MHRAHTGLSQMEPSTEMGSVHQSPPPTQKLSPINIYSKKKFCNKSLTRYTNHSLWATQNEFNGILGTFPLIDLLLMFSWLYFLSSCADLCLNACVLFFFGPFCFVLFWLFYYWLFIIIICTWILLRERVDLGRWECGRIWERRLIRIYYIKIFV